MKKTVIAILLLLVALPAVAEDAPPKAPEQSYHWLIYYNGARVGWHSTVVTRTELDGAAVIREDDRSQITISRSFDQQTFVSTYNTSTWMKPCGTPLRREVRSRNGDQARQYVVVIAEEQVSITETIDDGTPKTSTHPVGDKPVLTSNGAWLMVSANGKPEPGTVVEYLSVSHGDHALVPQVLTVIGESTRKLRCGTTVTGTEVQLIDGGRVHTAVVGADTQPKVLRAGGGFEFERTPKLPEDFKPEPVRLANIMESDVNVREFRQLEEMEMRFDFVHDDEHEAIPPLADSNGYHRVTREENGYRFTLTSQRLSDEAAKVAFPLAEIPEDIQPLLRATPMCQADDEVLKREALRITRDSKTAAEATRAIMQFVKGRLGFGSGDTGSASARQAYDEKQGDCTEHAALFVALARAAGLPARNVSGLAYISAGRNRAIWGFHAWAEVWLGEWVPVDTTVDELGISARYIMMYIDEPGDVHGRGRGSRCMQQNIQPVILSYRLSSGRTWQRRE